MDIIITDWALQSYLDMKHKKVFTNQEYTNLLRPDALALRTDFPNKGKFRQSSFWGPAKHKGGKKVTDGFKMKWDSIGNGNVELRLGVAILGSEAFLCKAYVKDSPKRDYREAANLERYIENIKQGHYIHRGYLK